VALVLGLVGGPLAADEAQHEGHGTDGIVDEANGAAAPRSNRWSSSQMRRQSSRQRDQATATIMTFVSLVKVIRQLRR
jgi:hypothetical protein